MKKIVLVSVGQPSTNPRIVKEANLLASEGFDVFVVYSYWTEWARVADMALFKEVLWTPVLAGGSPFENRFIYFFTRVRSKLFQFLAKKVTFRLGIAEIARGRTYPELLRKAKSIKASLYIGHIQAALPVVVKAAGKNRAKCGFDAEDFHRQEVDDDPNSYYYRISQFIEDKYIQKVDYLSAASPLISDQYAMIYKVSPQVVLNVFPRVKDHAVRFNEDNPLGLFWFSQTIGTNRGIELIIDAMRICKAGLVLNLLGQCSEEYACHLKTLARQKGIDPEQIHFFPPVKGQDIFKMASQFDIGVASESGFCLNNNLALSNKIFTYIQCGLAVVASNTPAQSALLKKYFNVGKVYTSAKELASIFDFYDKNRGLLYQTKKDAYQMGQTDLNWEIEGKKFLAVAKDILDDE